MATSRLAAYRLAREMLNWDPEEVLRQAVFAARRALAMLEEDREKWEGWWGHGG